MVKGLCRSAKSLLNLSLGVVCVISSPIRKANAKPNKEGSSGCNL